MAELSIQMMSKYLWLLPSVNTCLVPRPPYFAIVIRFGSLGPGHSFWSRHQNQLTVKVCEKAIQELGKVNTSVEKKVADLGLLFHFGRNIFCSVKQQVRSI